MKLIIAIVHDEDANNIIDEFNENNLKITMMSSTGGFRKSGNTTLLSGVEDDDVERAINIIASFSQGGGEIPKEDSRKKLALKIKENKKVSIGRGVIFITDVERFEKF